jgi:formate dehydrogenase major subunit/formate dehydrogenase alpha subunit
MSNSIAELEQARLILAVGTNTTESHPVLSMQVKAAVRRGARLIVVDPRRIELTSFATRWLPLRVGSDTALFNAMARIIIDEELYDERFVSEHTKGFEELREHVGACSVERAEEITGVPAAEIVAAAREYATTRPASIIYTLGVTEHTCGVHNVQSLANLALLCGNFGRPSSGVNPLRGQNNVQGAGDMGCLPNNFPGYQKVVEPETRRHWEEVWGVPLSGTPGITKITALDRILKGEVRAAYIMGENTVVSDANAAHTREALEALELLVVQDLFLTQTARLADVVLPAAGWPETEGTFTNTERRVQRVRQAVSPPGQAREDWRIVADLAARMGHEMPFADASEVWSEVATATPLLAGITWDRLEPDGIQWPCPDPDHPGTPYLHEGLWTGEQVGTFQPVPYVPPAEPADDAFPFVLSTGRRRTAYHTQTQTGRTPLKTLAPHEVVEIHPEDGARLGIGDRQRVAVISRRGRVEVAASLTDRSPRGVVFLSFHHPDEVWTNLLTTDAYDPFTETPEFKACAVRIEPVV